ncbi:MAG: THUMP domain-containing protein [Bacteroidota bacterium]
MKLLIKTFAGLEEILADELHALGANDIEIRKRAVSCAGDQALLYRANLWLRTGIRILIPIHSFDARNENAIYEELKTLDWSEHLQLHQTFAIDALSQSTRFKHNHYLSLKTKDAIVDWFRERKGKRPSVNTRTPHLRFHLHVDHHHRATLLADSSGEGLHRRGYRTDGGAAPLNEALAAGLVKLSGWQPEEAFVDFMCGSGTILIEAAMIAANQAPGLHRKFAFQEWQDFDTNLWQDIKMEARQARRPHEVPIIGVDSHFKAIHIAENNIDAAHLQSYIRVRRSKFQNYLPPEAPGTLISNPPYGLRVESDDIESLYQEIGDKLKKDFTGYKAWILSGNIPALKTLGLRPSRKIHLYNGQLECRFHRFDLYQGSKKKKEE